VPLALLLQGRWCGYVKTSAEISNVIAIQVAVVSTVILDYEKPYVRKFRRTKRGVSQGTLRVFWEHQKKLS
jgi:hypothetical protein